MTQESRSTRGAAAGFPFCDQAGQFAAMTGFTGHIVWDDFKPSGQQRRCLDLSWAERDFGFRAVTGFDEALRRTIDWYKVSKCQAADESERTL